MLQMLLSRTGITAIIAVLLLSVLGAQTLRLSSAKAKLTTSTALVAACRADNARLDGELSAATGAIERQNEAVRILEVKAATANKLADEAAARAMKAARAARNERRPTEHVTLNARLAEVFQ